MKQVDFISGFSELKDLLMRTYRIDGERANLRLHFTETGNELFLHNFANHKQSVQLVLNVKAKLVRSDLPMGARRLIAEALRQVSTAEFLNQQFLLNGFFRP